MSAAPPSRQTMSAHGEPWSKAVSPMRSSATTGPSSPATTIRSSWFPKGRPAPSAAHAATRPVRSPCRHVRPAIPALRSPTAPAAFWPAVPNRKARSPTPASARTARRRASSPSTSATSTTRRRSTPGTKPVPGLRTCSTCTPPCSPATHTPPTAQANGRAPRRSARTCPSSRCSTTMRTSPRSSPMRRLAAPTTPPSR